MWNEVIVTYLEELSRNLRVMTEKIHQIPQSGPGCEPGISGLRSGVTPLDLKFRSSPLMETDRSLPCSQKQVNALYPLSDESRHMVCLFLRSILKYSFPYVYKPPKWFLHSDSPIDILCERSLTKTLKAHVQILCVLQTVLKYINECHSAKARS
jgi:hypothetical protein